MGTKNGLNYFQKKKDVFVRLFSLRGSSNSLSSNNINTLYLAGEDLWVGTPAGLDRVNTKTMSVERYAGAHWLSMVGIYSVTKILPFKSGTPMSGFWLATIGGLVYYDENMASFQDVIHPDIFGRYVADMYDDPRGNLWLSIPQTGGLIHFNTTNFYLMYGFIDPDQDFQHIINNPVDP